MAKARLQLQRASKTFRPGDIISGDIYFHIGYFFAKKLRKGEIFV